MLISKHHVEQVSPLAISRTADPALHRLLYSGLGSGEGAGELTPPLSICPTQAQIQGPELAHPNSYPIYDLLECMKGMGLSNHSHRISRTLGNSRISVRILGAGPV